MKTINPHDKFFKEAFSKKEEAGDLIKNVLPEGLSKNIDVSTLQLDSTSYIDEELQENFSDLVYNCVYKGKTKIKVSFLIEHKSYTVDYPHLQLLKYLQKIWEANIKQKTALVPVIPILVYHGKEKWGKKRFEDYFSGIDDELKQFLPVFDYIYVDLSAYPDEEIDRRFQLLTVRIGLMLMKYIFDEATLRRKLPQIFSGVEAIVETETGEKFLVSIFLYVFSNTEIEDEDIIKAVKLNSEKGGNIAMTTATKLINKGLKEGLKEGLMKGKKQEIVNLFTKLGLSVEQIVRTYEYDKSFVEMALKEQGLI